MSQHRGCRRQRAAHHHRLRGRHRLRSIPAIPTARRRVTRRESPSARCPRSGTPRARSSNRPTLPTSRGGPTTRSHPPRGACRSAQRPGSTGGWAAAGALEAIQPHPSQRSQSRRHPPPVHLQPSPGFRAAAATTCHLRTACRQGATSPPLSPPRRWRRRQRPRCRPTLRAREREGAAWEAQQMARWRRGSWTPNRTAALLGRPAVGRSSPSKACRSGTGRTG